MCVTLNLDITKVKQNNPTKQIWVDKQTNEISPILIVNQTSYVCTVKNSSAKSERLFLYTTKSMKF